MSAPPKVVGVIGARLNSSRLPRKQLLDLAGRPLIDRLFQRLDHIPAIDSLVLATTADDYNRPLVQWAESRGRQVLAYPGDVNDLVGRVDEVVRQEDPDILIYICGDSPLIEPDTVSRMIQALRAEPDADRAALPDPGADRRFVHEGFSVYRRDFWDRIVAASQAPYEREHVGVVAGALKKISHRNAVVQDEPTEFAGIAHRISVDTPSDYRFMAEVYRRWYHDHTDDSIVSLSWVLEQLEQDPQLRAINRDVRQKTPRERSRTAYFLTLAEEPRLRRCSELASALQDRHSIGTRFLVLGEETDLPWLRLFECRWFQDPDSLLDAASTLAQPPRAMLVYDMPGAQAIPRLAVFTRSMVDRGVIQTTLDSAISVNAGLTESPQTLQLAARLVQQLDQATAV